VGGDPLKTENSSTVPFSNNRNFSELSEKTPDLETAKKYFFRH
jgi:hypothetical protein